MNYDIETVRGYVEDTASSHLERLAAGLEASTNALDEFQSWIAGVMQNIGMDVDRFVVSPQEVSDQPSCLKSLRENPSSLQTGANLVGQLKGAFPNRPKILLFGHADKSPESFEYGKTQPELSEREGRLYGPGIADDVSGLTAMLSAVEVIRKMKLPLAGDVMVASVLGKQMGVYGTFGLVTKYGPMDEAIYVHPAESGSGLREIKMSSNGLLELHIEIDGRAPTSGDNQTVFSGTGINAATKAIDLFMQLSSWADAASVRYHDDSLHAAAGRSVCAMLSRLLAGENGELCDLPVHARLVIMISFPPRAALDTIRNEVIDTLNQAISADTWLSQNHIRFEWGDRIAESITADSQSPFLRKAAHIIAEVTGEEPSYYHGHGGSDIRYPMLHWNAQAFGFGPKAGNLGLKDEWVDKKEYLQTIVALVGLLTQESV